MSGCLQSSGLYEQNRQSLGTTFLIQRSLAMRWFVAPGSDTRYTPRILRMDFDKSCSRKICEWNSSSHLLRAKEDNFNDVCLESSKLDVVNHGQGSQDSNNFKTKVGPSSMHVETVESTIRVAPASSKSSSGSSGGNSNPTSIHLIAKFIYVKKEIPKEGSIWTKLLGCPKCKRDSFETRISKCVTNMVRHHDQDERETDGARHWVVYSQYWKGNSEINRRKSSRTRTGSIAFILEASRRGSKSVKMVMEN